MTQAIRAAFWSIVISIDVSVIVLVILHQWVAFAIVFSFGLIFPALFRRLYS